MCLVRGPRQAVQNSRSPHFTRIWWKPFSWKNGGGGRASLRPAAKPDSTTFSRFSPKPLETSSLLIFLEKDGTS